MSTVIIKNGEIVCCVNVATRHVTPRWMCHLLFSGVSGRRAFNGLDPNAAGLWVAQHPTLGDPAAWPALFTRAEDGGPLHVYNFGDWPQPLEAEDFEALDRIEVWALGRMARWANGEDRDGGAFCALRWTDPAGDALIDAIKPGAIAWDDRVTPFRDAPEIYKTDAGGPLVDPDEVHGVTEVWPYVPEPEPE